jgi:hypothetical protein
MGVYPGIMQWLTLLQQPEMSIHVTPFPNAICLRN